MQSAIAEFLAANYPNLYLASEIAEAVGISKGSALRQLKKLAAKGQVITKEGRYGSSATAPQKPGDRIQEQIQSLSDLTGIPKNLIGYWVEDVKARKKEPTG